MKKRKAFHFAIIAAAVAAGSVLYPFLRPPIHAAALGTAVQQTTAGDSGAASYMEHCAVCHGKSRQGNPPAFPSLIGVENKLSESQIADLVHHGKGTMPPFPAIQDPELSALIHFVRTPAEGTKPAEALKQDEASTDGEEKASAGGDAVKVGAALFRQNCSFCHGRDAQGGETGPDLTQSKLVLADKTGDAIIAVIRDGRPAKKMPAFKFSSEEMHSLVAFIHARVAFAAAHPGGRRGVDVADLQTGDADAGKQYFNGAGGCAKCHSPTGDLSGIASRFEGLKLEMQMLYPWEAKRQVTVTLASGEKVAGTLAYMDEFTVALREPDGTYRSWFKNRVHSKVDPGLDAHIELFPKYTDDDIHNLMAYLQTLR